MKYFLFLLLLGSATTRSQSVDVITYPEPVGRVNDFSHILSEQQVTTLDSIISNFKKQTANNITIVTIDSLPANTTINDYTLDLARKWAITKEEYGKGLVFLFAMKNRKVRIEVSRDMEAVMTNERCSFIIDTFIIPNFRKADYYNGIQLALSAAMADLSNPSKNADR